LSSVVFEALKLSQLRLLRSDLTSIESIDCLLSTAEGATIQICEFLFSATLMSKTQSIPFFFLAQSVAFMAIFSVPDLAPLHWSLSSAADWSGPAHRLFGDVHFTILLFLDLSIVSARGHLWIAHPSLLFIFTVIHSSDS
jgi:hypothetical protein